jgi:hypothetical protein
MITDIAILLVVLWLVGFIGFPILGGFIHILLAVAIVLFLVRLITT